MKTNLKRIVSMVLTVAMVLSMLTVSAYAASTSKAGGYYYTVDEAGNATIVSIDSSLKSGDNKGAGTALLIPATLDGNTVTTFGGSGILLTNYEGAILFPEGITTIADGAIYDCGNTGSAYFSFSSTITSMTSKALQSTQNKYYSLSDVATAAATTFGLSAGTASTKTLTIEGGENGAIYPNGTYNVPVTSTESFTLEITADLGYKIAELVIDGNAVAAAAGENEYSYSTTLAISSVTVTFEEDAEDTRTESTDPADTYEAPAIVAEAVAEGATLPEDVYEYVGASDNASAYLDTMGIETGTYYAIDGVIYEMVAICQNVEYNSKAEVINAYYESEGLVYGTDYDYIRLYHYVVAYSNGPRPGDFDMYCTYLYKAVGSTITGATSNYLWEGFYEHCTAIVEWDEDGMISSATKVEGSDAEIQGDVATVMVQAGSTVTINDLVSTNNTVAYGPSEAANFYGLGSSVLVDGGLATGYAISSGTSYSFIQETDASSVILNNPTIIGIQNIVYAVAGGTAYVYGGRFFGSSSGGHGFYVGMGGKIAVNADNVLDANGQAITDIATLMETATNLRPSIDLGIAVSADETTNQVALAAIAADNWETPAAPEYDEDKIAAEEAAAGVTYSVLVTADETGTALTTDTGGGVIVANNISATTYGRGCAGVYSIGSDESYVFVYNSALHSNMDAALCSASAGYIFAYNCELQGVSAIKTRSGGSGTWAGVEVYNSKLICQFDPDNYSFYDMSNPDDEWPTAYYKWAFADDTSLVNCPMLNMFINKTSYSYGQDITEEMSYWFYDKTTAPQTGEAIAVIVSTGTAPIEVHSSYLVNNNYNNYKDEGAENTLIAADNAGSGSIYFYDCNSSTQWDVTGVCSETTELYGNIKISAIVTMSGPDAGSGPSSAPVYFYNSEWSGAVTGYSKGAYITLDETSIWHVDTQWIDTDWTAVCDLTMASESCIDAAVAVTVKILGTLTIAGEEIDLSAGSYTIGNVTFVAGVSAVFSDLDGSYSWCAEAADNLYYNGIVYGVETGVYGPDSTLTRAQLITMIYRMADGEASEGTVSFTDVVVGSYYYDAVVWGYENGVIYGRTETIFDPNASVTREEAMSMLYRAQDLIGYSLDTEVESVDEALSVFTDADSISTYAREAVATLTTNEIVVGMGDGTVAPTATMTRAEAASLLNAIFEAIPASSSGGMGGMGDMGMGDMGMGDMGDMGDMGGMGMGG